MISTIVEKRGIFLLLLLGFGRDVAPNSSKMIVESFKTICLGNYPTIILVVALNSAQGGVFKEQFLNQGRAAFCMPGFLKSFRPRTLVYVCVCVRLRRH